MYDLDEIMAQYGDVDAAATIEGVKELGDSLQFNVSSPPSSDDPISADTPQTNATEEDEEVKWDLLLHATATSVLDDTEDGEVHITQEHHKATGKEYSLDVEESFSYQESYTYGYKEKEEEATGVDHTPVNGYRKVGTSYNKGVKGALKPVPCEPLPSFPLDVPFGVSPVSHSHCLPWRVTVASDGSYYTYTPEYGGSSPSRSYPDYSGAVKKQPFYSKAHMAPGRQYHEVPVTVPRYGRPW
eukprot:TRINITY_DN1115_c0_g1_i1.p1 TRINITY_DN1115_c0_g1~~TRINITY_DN1115_c0_g1_i1.p1  ORF type:complete len:242 (+),score=36.38 TRINITY_DN1115_c0_g1_i1:200-925(+)